MGEEIELAAKVAGESIEALAKASGVLGPVKALADFLTAKIYYRHLPTVAREATKAAETIERLGLPRAAVPDELVLRILEEGARTDDESMQERWANLLANALTECSAEVHPAFAKVLGEITPTETATLELIAGDHYLDAPVPDHVCTEKTGVDRTGLDNLVRLELLRYNRTQPTTWGSLDDAQATIAGVMLTEFGMALVKACRTPAW
jgi:hypothetical protein